MSSPYNRSYIIVIILLLHVRLAYVVAMLCAVDMVSTNWYRIIKFSGGMVVLALLGTRFIIENCSLDWWKVVGIQIYVILRPVEHILLPSLNQVRDSFFLVCSILNDLYAAQSYSIFWVFQCGPTDLGLENI